MNRKRRSGKPNIRGGLILSGLALALLAVGVVIGLLLPTPLRISGEGEPSPARETAAEDAGVPGGARDTPTPKAAESQDGRGRETPSAPEPAPSAAPESDARVRRLLGEMTLREKICQMLIVLPDSLTGVDGTITAGDITKGALEKYPVGGLIYFSQNITGAEQIKKFNETVQTYAKIPMFLAVDEEGGRVGRLKTSLAAHSVGAMLTYKDAGAETAYQNALTLSAALKQYGFNMDFAPVADVWSNPANTVIGDRAYSDSFEQAAALVPAAVRGFRDGEVVCVLKHFPGHGDTSEDSHDGAAYIRKTPQELRGAELLPFAAGIGAGADMVMLGHLIVSEIDELPATLSEKIVTGVLRGELGYDGVVITDALNMRAMAENYSAEQIAVSAVKAGADILLMPPGVAKTVDALTRAVERGEIPESRIDESAARILALKLSRGIL
ncbi:MAG: glycoside hydrolase family 3 protein [Oscillospiraceae bacterium]|jgi:beta-N-acetylhexosaminidase|nr:glycoside hydrolase family 3 protein [Oscillospiraceae bacterium]